MTARAMSSGHECAADTWQGPVMIAISVGGTDGEFRVSLFHPAGLRLKDLVRANATKAGTVAAQDALNSTRAALVILADC